jgi:Zn finger protein HypA/HybF involved in hydrogenase expression
MHEFSSVKMAVQDILQQIEKEPSKRIKTLRLRRGGTMTEDAVRQAFQACAAGTPLAKATLKLEPRMVPVRCGCGHLATLNVTEQDSYPYVCPKCGDLVEVSPGPALELMEIIYDPPTASTWCGASAAESESGEQD